jgi:peptide/nickel transport system ATP-binding protein
VLTVDDLRVRYNTVAGPVNAVNGVSFVLRRNEKVGLVGESGSGKSTTALALLRLIKPPGHITGGSVRLDGRDVLSMSEEQLRQARFAEISLVPQGAMNSLNPVMRIRDQIMDVIQTHDDGASRASARARVDDLLDWVGLPAATARMYPHELSGGMKQRVCMALAISLSPKVIIADEPTSALDVVVQRNVIETLERIREDLGVAVLLVGHDMALMAQFADRIGVMYAGSLVEVASTTALFDEPLHPYTQLLLGSLPSLDTKGAFKGIPGVAPSLRAIPPGCPFHPRCPMVMAECAEAAPPLRQLRPDHWVSCHLY